MIIGIDFDGTCVTHEFPEIGGPVGAVNVLRKLIEKEHQLILFTMRSDIENPETRFKEIVPLPGQYLTEAVNWFKERDIPLWGINENPEQKSWTSSPKAYCHLYIDDAGLGIPLIYGQHPRPFVDWLKVEQELIRIGIL